MLVCRTIYSIKSYLVHAEEGVEVCIEEVLLSVCQAVRRDLISHHNGGDYTVANTTPHNPRQVIGNVIHCITRHAIHHMVRRTIY